MEYYYQDPDIVVHHITALLEHHQQITGETDGWYVGQGFIRDKALDFSYQYIKRMIIYPCNPQIIPSIINFLVQVYRVERDFWYKWNHGAIEQEIEWELVVYKKEKPSKILEGNCTT